MLSTLPTILNTASLAHADPAAGPAPRDSAAAGPGFAALMQQQTNLRLADQRMAEQRLSEQRLLEQRLAGQRQGEPRSMATPAQPPAATREPVARPAEASRLDAARNDRPTTTEPSAASAAQADAPARTDAAAGASARAARPQPAASADESDTAASPSASRRRSLDAEARAQTLADTASLARARSAARTAQRLTAAADAATTTPPAALQAADRGLASTTGMTGADAAALPTATTAAAPDAIALQTVLQTGLQGMVPGGQNVPRPDAQAPGPEVGTDAASALAALTDRTLRQADASTTNTRSGAASATGQTPIAPGTLPAAEAALTDAEGRRLTTDPALSSRPTANHLSSPAADPRAPGRTAQHAAAAEIDRTPAEAAAPTAPARTAAALAAQAALALDGAARPTAAAGTPTREPGTGIDPSAPLADRDINIDDATSATTSEAAAAAAAALAAAVDTTATAATAAASTSQANARGVAAPTAVTTATIAGTVAAAGTQQRAPGTGMPTTGAEAQRSSGAASTPTGGPAGSASPASADAAADRGAPDGLPAGMASTGAPGRAAGADTGADAARLALDGSSTPGGLKDDAAAAARPPEPNGLLATAHAGTRADAQNTSTRTDLLRVAEAGPADASNPTPMSMMAPTGGTTAASAPPAAAAPVPEARIPVPLDSPAFAPALGAQISLFARDGVQTARLQLNPAEMGPISVQIALDGNAARVDFQADLAGTREVIEASLPALAGALQDAGLTLTGGGVFQQAPGRQGQDHPPASVPLQRSAGRDADGGQAGPPLETLVRARRGLVDLVA